MTQFEEYDTHWFHLHFSFIQIKMIDCMMRVFSLNFAIVIPSQSTWFCLNVEIFNWIYSSNQNNVRNFTIERLNFKKLYLILWLGGRWFGYYYLYGFSVWNMWLTFQPRFFKRMERQCCRLYVHLLYAHLAWNYLGTIFAELRKYLKFYVFYGSERNQLITVIENCHHLTDSEYCLPSVEPT